MWRINTYTPNLLNNKLVSSCKVVRMAYPINTDLHRFNKFN